jgi:lipoate-protein ligase A
MPATSARAAKSSLTEVARWRHLVTPAASGAWNMAFDEALLHRARETGETVLRVYTWSAPTLSLGRNQRAAGLYDLELARARGVEFVRRPTGGRAVLHHREITYSVTAPVSDANLRDSYERINALLVRALRILGVDVSVATNEQPAPLPDASPCFEVPTVGELTFRGRKLVGSAQWREDGALLQHGSILIDDDQRLIAQLSRGMPSPSVEPATLREALGRAPDGYEIAEALIDATSESGDDPGALLVPDAELLGRAGMLEARYSSSDWTWRR